MHMRKLTHTIAAVVTGLTLMATPALARERDHSESEHGPIPIAIIGSVLGGSLWLVSVPFSAILAPAHIMDSFDALVLAPLRAATGKS